MTPGARAARPPRSLRPGLRRRDPVCCSCWIFRRPNHPQTYGIGPTWMLVGWPPLKCSSDSVPVAMVSQRVSEFLGSRATVTQAIAEYQGSDQGATTIQANVRAQVAATTVGTSGERRLYRYQASASISGGQVNPMMVVTSWPLPKISSTQRQTEGEMTIFDACPSGLSATRP